MTITRVSVDSAGNRERLLSVSSSGDRGNSISYIPSISANGQKVAFSSASTNLVPGDTNYQIDIFVVYLAG